MEDVGGGFKFNEGIYQMERIHQLQTQLNFAKNIPLLKDSSGLYAYQTWFSLLNSLFLEFASKLNEEELSAVNEKRLNLKKNCPTVMRIRRDVNGKPHHEINFEAWNYVEECLIDYEIKLKQLMVKHKISSPEAQDPSKAVIN